MSFYGDDSSIQKRIARARKQAQDQMLEEIQNMASSFFHNEDYLVPRGHDFKVRERVHSGKDRDAIIEEINAEAQDFHINCVKRKTVELLNQSIPSELIGIILDFSVIVLGKPRFVNVYQQIQNIQEMRYGTVLTENSETCIVKQKFGKMKRFPLSKIVEYSFLGEFSLRYISDLIENREQCVKFTREEVSIVEKSESGYLFKYKSNFTLGNHVFYYDRKRWKKEDEELAYWKSLVVT